MACVRVTCFPLWVKYNYDGNGNEMSFPIYMFGHVCTFVKMEKLSNNVQISVIMT